MRLLKESPFHVRKEAAFALANICADGGGGTGAAAAMGAATVPWPFAALPGWAPGVRRADASLTLTLCRSVPRHHRQP